MQIIPVRVFYSKTGRVKYISHLDTVRTLSRALKRSKLPIWYTQGFNPHMYVTFAMPISLGHESLTEIMDMRFTEEVDFDEALEKIKDNFPPGFCPIKIAEPVMNAKEICYAEYEIELGYDDCKAENLQTLFSSFNEQEKLEVTKKSKKGDKTIDIKPSVKVLDKNIKEKSINISLLTAAGNTLNINPELYLNAFYNFAETTPQEIQIIRKKLFTSDMQEFK